MPHARASSSNATTAGHACSLAHARAAILQAQHYVRTPLLLRTELRPKYGEIYTTKASHKRSDQASETDAMAADLLGTGMRQKHRRRITRRAVVVVFLQKEFSSIASQHMKVPDGAPTPLLRVSQLRFRVDGRQMTETDQDFHGSWAVNQCVLCHAGFPFADGAYVIPKRPTGTLQAVRTKVSSFDLSVADTAPIQTNGRLAKVNVQRCSSGIIPWQLVPAAGLQLGSCFSAVVRTQTESPGPSWGRAR